MSLHQLWADSMLADANEFGTEQADRTIVGNGCAQGKIAEAFHGRKQCGRLKWQRVDVVRGTTLVVFCVW